VAPCERSGRRPLVKRADVWSVWKCLPPDPTLHRFSALDQWWIPEAAENAAETARAAVVKPKRCQPIDDIGISTTFPTGEKKASNINADIAEVSTTRRWLGDERSFLAR
jgi:hypothetical protein